MRRSAGRLGCDALFEWRLFSLEELHASVDGPLADYDQFHSELDDI